MRYLIEAFDKATDLQAFVVELPHGCEDKLKTIMQWSDEQYGWEGYNLTPTQLAAIESLAGRTIGTPCSFFPTHLQYLTREPEAEKGLNKHYVLSINYRFLPGPEARWFVAAPIRHRRGSA